MRFKVQRNANGAVMTQSVGTPEERASGPAKRKPLHERIAEDKETRRRSEATKRSKIVRDATGEITVEGGKGGSDKGFGDHIADPFGDPKPDELPSLEEDAEEVSDIETANAATAAALEAAKATATEGETTEEQPSTFPCEQCDFVAATATGLASHVRARHAA
jgi:hypothetical protein